ncbi:MAG: signal peptide peptidase SppA [Flavobacteriales bacterium]
MLNFLKRLVGSVLTMVISFFIIFFVIIGIIVSSSSDAEETTIKNNSVLKINFKGQIIDRGNDEIDIENIINQSEEKVGLNNILSSIEKAKKDDRIKGIYLNVENISASIATLEEIRNKLKEFKDSTNKFILSYSEVYGQSAYYISSVADEIYLHPQGMLELKGLAYQGMFFKNTLEKLEVEAQIIRHGKFKSAVEPFMLEKMSKSNRMQVSRFLTSLWGDLTKGMSEGRSLSQKEINSMAQNLLIQEADQALQYNLVDKLAFKDELVDSLKSKLNLTKDQKINFVSLNKYKDVSVKDKNTKYSKNKIAVIYATGEINGGEGSPESIGSEGLSKTIREAREDKNVKAIVLRVNSPGGSALASETILREMALAKEAKPVIVSMGDVAASGGYYIACQADTIVANPTTITGSIGVFGVLMNAKEMMNNKLGITIDTVKTNKHADIGTIFRPLTRVERQIIQNSVENVYDTFISRVAIGRNLSKEYVDSVGQGRVWTGRDALELGLVDVLGGLETAIEISSNMADLQDYRIVNLPKQKDPIEVLLQDLMGEEVRSSIVKKELGDFYDTYMELKNINSMDQIQMRMPQTFEIR